MGDIYQLDKIGIINDNISILKERKLECMINILNNAKICIPADKNVSQRQND